MPTGQQINKQLARVLQSHCFSKSAVIKELLKYLVSKSMSGDSPKELEIAYEVFGQKDNPSKEKNIRIYIYNLRKKLKEYYDDEGMHDEVLFSIPKGGYVVSFDLNKRVALKSKLHKLTPYILGLSVLILFCSVILFFSHSKPKAANQFMWKDFYKSNYPTLIVLGDHYFVRTRNVLGNMTSARFLDINTDNDFDSLLLKHPEISGDIEKTDQSYINKQGPYSLYKVMDILGGSKVDLNLCYSSTLKWEDLTGTNSIFIGSYKTQHILKSVFEEVGIAYRVRNAELLYTNKDTTYSFCPGRRGILRLEYATLLHFHTSDNKQVIALMCNSDIGNVATAKYLSIPANLKELENITKQFPAKNFKAVFEVQGQEQTDFKITLKQIDPIDIDIDNVWP